MLNNQQFPPQPPPIPGIFQSSAQSNIKPGFYVLEINKSVWVVPQRYQDLAPIGTGAYGIVCSAKCMDTGDKVAIKKFSRPFQSVIHAKRTHRELRLLRLMNHENVIGLYDAFTPDTDAATMSDVYFVTVLMGADLSNILKIQRLSDDHIQFLVYQILRALKYVHSAGIIHRDLKPSNIAVNEDCELKILDFGLARHTDLEMTGYVATRWYRAPEIMLNWMHYSQTVDMWSVGCIMAEMITSKTLFPGADHIDQLTRIMNVCGTPSDELLGKISSEEARNYIRSMPKVERKDFKKFFAGATPDAVDFLEKTLNLDPDYRPTAAEAMQHPYFKQYHEPNDEPTSELIELDVEQELSVDQWRQLIWVEIEEFTRFKQQQQTTPLSAASEAPMDYGRGKNERQQQQLFQQQMGSESGPGEGQIAAAVKTPNCCMSIGMDVMTLADRTPTTVADCYNIGIVGSDEDGDAVGAAPSTGTNDETGGQEIGTADEGWA